MVAAHRNRIQFQFEQPLLQGYGVEINQLRTTHPGSILTPFSTASRVEGILITRIRLEEERLDSLTVEAWRQTSVTLQIASAGATDYLNVDPQDLRDAMLRDGDDSIDPALPAPGARQRDVLRLRLP